MSTTTESIKMHLPKEVQALAEKVLSRSNPRSFLIPLLHKLQDVEGYLKEEYLVEIASLLGITKAEVIGVASFYNHFKLTPQGKHSIAICLGTACHVKGAGFVADKIKELLGISEGQTTPDKQFSFVAARCLGMCAMAPVLMVDGKVFGSVKPEMVEGILSQYGYKGGK